MDKDVRDALELITAVLELLNSNLEEIDKRVTILEADKIDDEYITIRIPKNASNLDVLRKVFDCKIINVDDYELGIAHLDMDDDTLFNTRWLKTRYKGGCDNETNK